MSASWIPEPEREAPRDAREARRLSRMEETWKVLAPSDWEVAAKRRQALPRALGRKARRSRPVLWGLAAALAAGAVFAAGGVLVWNPGSSERASSNAAPAPSSALAGRPSLRKDAPTEVAPTKSESEATLPGTSPHEPEHLLRAAPPPRDGSEAEASRVAQSVSQDPPSSTAGRTTESWDAVAAALREDDPARAREVLDSLTKRRDPATRDAAALARAQLDWSQGERESARRELVRLAASGATKEIRAQAARSIERFEER